jgi:hypothetical protein
MAHVPILLVFFFFSRIFIRFSFSLRTVLRLGGVSTHEAAYVHGRYPNATDMSMKNMRKYRMVLSRKVKKYTESVRLRVFDSKYSSMYSHDVVDDRESYSHTLALTCSASIYSVEFLFYIWHILIRDTTSIVRENNNTFRVRFFILTCKNCILTRILYEV